MATPIKGTKQSDPSINGTSGNDKLQGKDGNDFLKGGAGDDDIDGGKGFDTAVFSGSYFQYLITSLGTGNDKTLVKDMVGMDGTDLLKKVEALQFTDFTVNLTENNAAFTRADSAATGEDSSVNINVLANDADFEGDALTITAINGQAISVGGSVVLGSGASVTLNADQTLTYNPLAAFQSLNGGEQGGDSFTYTVTDSHGAASAPTGVAVTVNGAWDTPTYTVNDTVDASGRTPSGNLLVGSGIPASGFGLAHAADAGIELGLQVIYRQGPTVLSTDANGYSDGVLEYSVNTGSQSTVNGSFANNTARAAWSFEYSIVTGLNGETSDLGDFTFKLLVDKDPTAAIDYNELLMRTDPAAPGTADTIWKLVGPNIDVIGDDAGNPALPGQVAQNSQNIAFAYYGLPGTYATSLPGGYGPAQFDIKLQAFDALNTLIAENHIQVNVAPV